MVSQNHFSCEKQDFINSWGYISSYVFTRLGVLLPDNIQWKCSPVVNVTNEKTIRTYRNTEYYLDVVKIRWSSIGWYGREKDHSKRLQWSLRLASDEWFSAAVAVGLESSYPCTMNTRFAPRMNALRRLVCGDWPRKASRDESKSSRGFFLQQ